VWRRIKRTKFTTIRNGVFLIKNPNNRLILGGIHQGTVVLLMALRIKNGMLCLQPHTNSARASWDTCCNNDDIIFYYYSLRDIQLTWRMRGARVLNAFQCPRAIFSHFSSSARMPDNQIIALEVNCAHRVANLRYVSLFQ